MTAIQAAWARIRERYEAATQVLEESDDWRGETPSINDLIQAEYRAGRITEPERDAMRKHVEFWLPPRSSGAYLSPEYVAGAYYACGMWAPSASPMGLTEHAIILATVVILEEEAAA